MLVLTRKMQEQIRLGEEITITVLRIRGNTVKIGIEAPRGVRVIRGELPNFDGEPDEPESSSSSEPSDEPPGEELEEAPLAAVLRSAGRGKSQAKSSRAVLAPA
jgi:carbon storage regulator CsrA